MDIAELKRLAEAAGGDEWTFDVAIPERGFCAQVWDGEGNDVLTGRATDRGSAVAAFVSTANPAAVLELIADVDRLRRIESAARNLIAQRGRHNTEIAYRRLAEVMKGE